MKRVIKRIAAFLIAFCTVFSAVPLDGIGPIRVKAEEGDYVSKLEWLDALTKAFQLEVEEENYPDDYFSDSDTLSSDEYYILMLATEFGLVDTEAGEAVNAKEDVTREYVAHTMNVCMGVVREGTEYTFSESDTVTYPDDIEVAIEQGWLTLSNGYFYPEKGITTSEVSSILSYAETELEEQKIVENYNSQYQLKDDIIVIPSDVEVVLSDDDELTFTNLPTDVVLQSGSKFAVISNGLPIVRKVVSIANSETETIVKVESVEPADAFISADVQGTINGELADAKLTADSSVMSYIVGGTENEYFEDGQEYLSLKDTENNQLSAVKVVQSYEIPEAVRKAYNLSDGVTADISCTVSNVYADYKVSKSLAYLNVNMTVTFQCNVSVDVLKEIGISGSITLVKIPIETIGFATVTLDLKFAGKITVNLVEDVSAGVKWSKDSGVNLTRNFTKKAFTIQSRAEISAGVTVSADANIGFIKGKIYAKIGAKASVDSDVYTDGNTPTMCSQIYAYLYASVGCEVSLDVTIGFVTFYKKTWSQSYTIWDKNNSPVRVSFHFEDGKAVSRCTRTYKSDGKTPTNTYYKYYTPADSRYGYNGSSSGIGSDGNEYAIFDYQVLTDGTLEITGYHGNMSCLSIPDELDGRKVTSIGSSVFKNNSKLEYVIIPDSITNIGNGAFYSCKNIKNITLSKKLKSLGGRAFADCNSLKEIEIPKSLEKAYGGYYTEDYTVDYTDGPFAHCENLETVTFEEGTTHVAQYLFGHCTGLRKIKIPDTVTSIDYRAFDSCVNLKEVQLGNKISEIGGYAFRYCVSLEKITIPDSVNTLGEYSFAYCNGLKEIIMPDSITEVKYNAFYSCESLGKVMLSKNLKNLGGRAFADCNSLKEIEIPKSLEKAYGGYYTEDYAVDYTDGPFAHCENLETVTFEEGTTHVAQYLFGHCTGLRKIKIPDTVTSIDYRAFDSCVNLKEVQLGSKISEIGGYAFRYCVSLEKITIPDSVNTLGEYSFAYCNGLKEIIMPDSITEVKYNAFYSCESLGKVVLSKNLKSLGKSAFADCNSLTEITIPDSIKVIDVQVFSECELLEKVSLGKGVTAIYSDAFSNCTALHDIILPDSLSQIGSQVFYKCETLGSISIPDSVQSIGSSVFKGCIALKDVHIGWGVKSISNEMFSDCVALKEIVIPYNVLEIKSNAFKNDTSLVSITIPQKTASIAADAFSYPDKMTIYGVKGSYAETYANQKGIKFVNQTIPATKVELDSSEYVLYTGEQIRLIPNITPSNFTDLITYRSADEKIATVSEDGVVTAKSAGKVTVKVIVGGVSTSCTIEVRQKVTYVNIYTYSLNMAVNEEEQLEVNVGPDNAYNKEVLWSSSDETVATVSQNGLVTATGKGTCQIKATAMDGSGKYDTVNVTVDRVMHLVDSMEQLESTHPYEASCKDIWIYSVEGAESIDVTFSEDTYVEDGFDKINILDSYGNVYQSYTGSELAGKTITINEDTLRIQLVSDEQTNGYGFKVVDIKADTSEQECEHDGDTYLVGEIEATCSREGYTGDIYCEKCNEQISSGHVIEKDPTNHVGGTEIRNAKKASCTEEGYTGDTYCKGCNKIISSGKKIEKEDHSWNSGSDYFNNKEAGVLYTCKVCGKTKSVRNEKFTSLAKADDGNWYDYGNGLVSTYTGLRYYNGSWWYVEKGKINFEATTLCLYNGTWWYVEKGKVNFNATTLCLYGGTWWYVQKGKVNFGATTLCLYNGTWWYVEKGKVNFGATTLCNYGGSWWYVQKGKVNFGATTLCNYGGSWWYVQKGKVNFGATTLCNYGGTWWYVEKGKVNFNATTLCNYGGKWWYVQKGKVNFGATTLCKYNGTWWYVEKGAVNFNYTGYFKYYGTNYRIVKGVVKF